MTGPARGASPCGDRATVLRLARLRAEDRIDPSGQSALRTHLSACPGCFAEAVAVDPTLLFVRLSASAEAGDVARHATGRGRERGEGMAEAEVLAADVLAAIRLRATEGDRRPVRLPRILRHGLRAAAAVLLAAGLATVLLLRRPPVPAGEGGAVSLAAARNLKARPLVEEVSSPRARVYEFEAATLEEPSVVFVANPDADI